MKLAMEIVGKLHVKLNKNKTNQIVHLMWPNKIRMDLIQYGNSEENQKRQQQAGTVFNGFKVL